MLGTLWQDLKHGARMLRKNPGFSFVAMASIAIGVGANAAMFSLADTLVLRPLTVPRAERDHQRDDGGPEVRIRDARPPRPCRIRTTKRCAIADRTFSSLAGFRLIVASFADRTDQPAQRKFGMAVSGNLFDMLGVQPALGRAIGVNDDRVVGRDPVLVLDHDLWQQQFAGDPGVSADDSRRRRGHDRRWRHAGGLHRAGSIRPSGVLRPVRDHAGADSGRRRRSNSPTARFGTSRSKDVSSLVCRSSRPREDVALIGEVCRRSYPDTNRNYGLTAQTEFDARVSARPQLAVAP